MTDILHGAIDSKGVVLCTLLDIEEASDNTLHAAYRMSLFGRKSSILWPSRWAKCYKTDKHPHAAVLLLLVQSKLVLRVEYGDSTNILCNSWNKVLKLR